MGSVFSVYSAYKLGRFVCKLNSSMKSAQLEMQNELRPFLKDTGNSALQQVSFGGFCGLKAFAGDMI